jgi:hypothetical protein
MTAYADRNWVTDEPETWAIDELDRVMGAETVRFPYKNAKLHGQTGGEWNYLQSLSDKVRWSLNGADMLTPYGMLPDVAADWITDRVAGLDGSTDAAMAWYVKTCKVALQQKRALRKAARRG